MKDKSLDSATIIWESILDALQQEITEQSFNTWFKDIELMRLDDSSLEVGVPNMFSKMWLEKRYEDRLAHAARKVTGSKLDVTITISKRLFKKMRSAQDKDRDVKAALELKAPKVAVRQAKAPRAPLNRNYTMARFLVGSCNRLAHSAALTIIESPGRAENPLVIHGGAGL